MDITVAVVTYDAAGCIQSCLDSLFNQEPHDGALEILVIDGCSKDGTQKIVRRFGDRVRLVENEKQTIASNRNVAIREALYPYIAFTDADCVVPSTWLNSLSKAYKTILKKDINVVGVGGGNIAPSSGGSFDVALGLALNSFIGSLGSVQGKVYDRQQFVVSLACLNVLYKKAGLEAVGGFDEQLENMCEDADVNYRLKRNGLTLYFIPGAEVEHCARRNLLSWFKNMYAYGIGRGRLMCKHRTLFSRAYLMVLIFIPFLIAGSLIGIIWPYALIVWLYIPMTLCAGFALAYKKKPYLGLPVGLILLGTHFCYAMGLWRGLTIGYPKYLTSDDNG
ncbi:glycosyltransferase [Thermodesulfobacteriota bacterium]